MKTGVRATAHIVARKSTCHFNTGAYADIGPRLIKNGGYGTGGPYHIPNVWVDSYAVYTTCHPPARSAATAHRKARGRTRRRWT